MIDMIGTAKQYVDNGFSVIPLVPNEKTPLFDWKEYQTRRPTHAEIDAWWGDCPEANIGVVTGKISGITVVDFDIKNGLSNRYNSFPKGMSVKTVSGGYHLYYKYTPNMRTGVDIFNDKSGIDIRNDGGYVVAPPSTINWNKYLSIGTPTLLDFPSELFSVDYKPKEKAPLTSLVGLQEGSRNDSIARVIGKLLKTCSKDKWIDEVWPVVQVINKTYTPPLPFDELKATYYSICNKEESSMIKSGNEDLNEFINKQDIGEVVKNIQNEKVKDAFLQGIAQYSGDDEMISSLEIMESMKKEGPMEKFMTGWSGLDSLIGGFTPGQIIVLTAPTKNGKTTFSMDLTRRMKEYSPAWFPFEEGPQELIGKYLERNEEPPLFFTPKAMIDNHLDWIERKIVEGLIKYNSRIFFIDHLHFIVPPNTQNMSQQIGMTMRRLKQIAKTWNVVIVLIAHLKKTRMDALPNLDDLRDSSFIGQEADTVIVMWRKTSRTKDGIEISDNTIVSVQANRRTGRTGNVKFTFKDGRFLEEDWEEGKEDDNGLF